MRKQKTQAENPLVTKAKTKEKHLHYIIQNQESQEDKMLRESSTHRDFILKETHKQWQDDKFTSISSDAEKMLGHPGRLISFSKSLGPAGGIYNANIFNESAKRIWYGDIDIVRDRENLLNLADHLGTLYILPEHKGRFLRGIPTQRYVQATALVIVGMRMWIDDQFILYMHEHEKYKSLVLKSYKKKRKLKPVKAAVKVRVK